MGQLRVVDGDAVVVAGDVDPREVLPESTESSTTSWTVAAPVGTTSIALPVLLTMVLRLTKTFVYEPAVDGAMSIPSAPWNAIVPFSM